MLKRFLRSRTALVVLCLAALAVGTVSLIARLVDGDESGGGLQIREVIAPDDGDSNTADGVTIRIAQARCAEDEVVTGGGFRIFGANRGIELQVRIKESEASTTDATPNVWTAVAHAPEGIGEWGLDARAMCAKAATETSPDSG